VMGSADALPIKSMGATSLCFRRTARLLIRPNVLVTAAKSPASVEAILGGNNAVRRTCDGHDGKIWWPVFTG
jgi:hypothetical protein